jgi:signal transduction histidine kinase
VKDVERLRHRGGPPHGSWHGPGWHGPGWHGPGWHGPPWGGQRPPGFALPFVVGVIQVVGSFGAEHGQPERTPLDALAVALLVAGPLALLARRRYPVQVLAVVAAVSLAYLFRGYPWGPFFLSFAVALLHAVSRGHRTAAWAAGVGTYVGYFALIRFVDDTVRPGYGAYLGTGAWLLVLLAVGELARVARERATEAERTRAEERRRQASDERLRIARELHDVLAHNISLINVRAGVALHLMDDDPEQVRAALVAIKEASRDTLREVRATLGVLRAVDEDAPRAPTAGLAGLPELADQVRAAGLPVRTEVAGEPRTLPAPVDLAAFRIVQEALTNVRRHAGRASATVLVGYGDGELTVRVDDDGTGTAPAGPPEPGGGNGIPGMRERAAALGGTLTAGPRPGGGFRVEAHLPLPADS